jgi:hypothetical protein
MSDSVARLHKPAYLSKLLRLVGGLLVFEFYTLQFMLPWWNRYLAITNEGWYHLSYAHLRPF